MSIDLKIELAKQEYLDAINKINNKYELPISIVEIILNEINNEVHNMKIIKIQKEQEEISNQEKESEK